MVQFGASKNINASIGVARHGPNISEPTEIATTEEIFNVVELILAMGLFIGLQYRMCFGRALFSRQF